MYCISSLMPSLSITSGVSGERQKPEVGTPLPVTIASLEKADKSGVCDEQEHKRYRIIVGNVLWLMRHTRPDLSFASCWLGQRMAAPTKFHLQMAERVLGYIRHTSNWGSRYLSSI